MTLEFQPADHSYCLDGRLVPSVTQILRAVMPPNYPGAGEWHMKRGTATHHGCRLSDEGRLDESSVDPEIAGRIAAWRKFRADWLAELIDCEVPLASARYRFAGTRDRLFRSGDDLVIADIKSSLERSVYPQLAAYRLLAHENGSDRITRAVAVEVRENGDYRCLWMDSRTLRSAEGVFLSCLSVFNFMRDNP